MGHDLGYDKLLARGIRGVLSLSTVDVDRKARDGNLGVFCKGLIRQEDPLTGKRISAGTALTGLAAGTLFTITTTLKTVINTVVPDKADDSPKRTTLGTPMEE